MRRRTVPTMTLGGVVAALVVAVAAPAGAAPPTVAATRPVQLTIASPLGGAPSDPLPDPVTGETEVTAATAPGDETFLDGRPSLPTGDVSALKVKQSRIRQGTTSITAPRAATAPSVTGYAVSSATMRAVAVGERGLEDNVLTRATGYGVVDATGVRMFIWPGTTEMWNHPVGQAQYVLHNLDSYRVTENPAYLEIARKNAQRLVDRKVESAGAWYYPYDFDFAVHGDTTELLKAPWYSAMAQGQALSAFVRMFEVTQDPAWRTAADTTFASLLQAPDGAAPFASRVDSSGRLWFEEYPRYPATNSEMVLNGHIFDLYGLHDYWMLTKNAEAQRLFLGGTATIERTVMTEFRRPSWLSVYSLRHQVNTLSYHKVHIAQFELMWRMTHDRRWITAATAFRNDYPSNLRTGTLRITPKVKVMYKLNSAGAISSSRSVRFLRNTGAPFDRRQRLMGGPIAYRISAGAYTGYWVAEAFGTAWGLGAIDAHGYTPAAPIVFRGGTTFTAYRLDHRGEVIGAKTLTVPTGRLTGAPTRTSAIVQGRPAYYFHSGTFAGYWVPMQTKIYLG